MDWGSEWKWEWLIVLYIDWFSELLSECKRLVLLCLLMFFIVKSSLATFFSPVWLSYHVFLQSLQLYPGRKDLRHVMGSTELAEQVITGVERVQIYMSMFMRSRTFIHRRIRFFLVFFFQNVEEIFFKDKYIVVWPCVFILKNDIVFLYKSVIVRWNSYRLLYMCSGTPIFESMRFT